MNLSNLRAAAFACCLLILPLRAYAQTPLDSLLDRTAASGVSGMLLAAQDGQILLERGFGYADSATRAPIDTATIFSIGSITKQFTRAAIIRLAQKGRLSLEDPLTRFIDGLPEDKRAITIGQVLDMRAGFHEYHDDDGDHQRMTKAEALRRIGEQKLLFAPGTSEAYSNSGYTLLAAVVEAASGRAFEDYVREELLEPAGLHSTGFYGETHWPEARFARGYGGKTVAGNLPNRWPRVSWALIGGGGMVSTPRDLMRWTLAMRSGTLLDSASLARMYRRGEWGAYAGGNDYGFTTGVVELRNGRDIVIMSSNAGGLQGPLLVGVAELRLGADLPRELRAALAPATPAPAAEGESGETGSTPPTSNDPADVTTRDLLTVLRTGSSDSIRAFVQERFAPSFRDAFPLNAHVEILGDVGAALRQSQQEVKLRPTGAQQREVSIAGPEGTIIVSVQVEAAAPYRITSIAIDG